MNALKLLHGLQIAFVVLYLFGMAAFVWRCRPDFNYPLKNGRTLWRAITAITILLWPFTTFACLVVDYRKGSK